MTSMTRRDLLKTTSAAALAYASTGPLIANQGELPSQKINVGVMGLSRGRSLAVSYARQPGVNVKYVCDVDSSRAGSAVAQLEKDTNQVPEPITDYRRMLDDPDLDIFVCAAPNHWHAPATILACSAGKHVYCEKPCSHNPWEGEMMVKAARHHDRAVQLGTQRRSNTGYIDAITKMHEGLIGNVYCARSWYNNLRDTIGIGRFAEVPGNLDYELWQGPAPRVPYYDNRIHYNWHWLWHWGNGELGNNGIHALDICRWGLGVDFPTSVVSSGGRYAFDDDQQTPDTNIVTFEFPEGKQISWQGLSCNRHKDSSGFVAFYGDQGACEIDGAGNYKFFDRNDKVIDEGESTLSNEPHVDNLIQAIRSGEHQNLNAEIEIGHRSTLLCHLGNISYQTRSALQCDPTNGHILDNAQAQNLWQREYEPGWKPQI
ncbi:Inositol 2-dehydrogenase [Thalassoglobus neptunius]|uniref:Inositol 2-dehydrogenase n=1 Tax=Thalassoglobus neptunius TaxID=1938619 RepID=A0A5C5V983_9PLAN|nr:Gfo/Idh/MocA family oxidoreductase [Thalassoglobus neptunius]TWT35108.1 Inositol 2-dehydrogenase [Thalassoglobus neptunius]